MPSTADTKGTKLMLCKWGQQVASEIQVQHVIGDATEVAAVTDPAQHSRVVQQCNLSYNFFSIIYRLHEISWSP